MPSLPNELPPNRFPRADYETAWTPNRIQTAQVPRMNISLLGLTISSASESEFVPSEVPLLVYYINLTQKGMVD